MRRLLVTLDDDLDKVLTGLPNQNLVVRAALRLYLCDIEEETLQGLRAGYANLAAKIKDMDSKIDYIASRIQ